MCGENGAIMAKWRKNVTRGGVKGKKEGGQ